MADDPKNDPAKGDPNDPAPTPTDDPEDLGEAGKRALAAERKAKKAAEKRAADAEAELKKVADKDKSETDRLREELAEAKKATAESDLRAMRIEVATAKGLSAAQAKRLNGSTKEELEEDADDFLESIKPAEDKGKPGGKPTEDLKGGGDPTEDPEELDPRKLADMVDRY